MISKRFTIPTLLSAISSSLHGVSAANLTENSIDINNDHNDKENDHSSSHNEPPQVGTCSEYPIKENVSVSATLTQAQVDDHNRGISPLKAIIMSPKPKFLSIDLFRRTSVVPFKQDNSQNSVPVTSVSSPPTNILII